MPTELETKLAPAMAVMGYSGLRPGQVKIIDALMAGTQPVLGVMPTSMGKSATFILPTLANNWRCLVISPLIALQEDQANKLLARGITAAAMNSMKNKEFQQLATTGWLS